MRHILMMMMVFFVVFGILLPTITKADRGCTGSSHIATQQDVLAGGSGIIVGQTIICDDLKESGGITMEAGQAKEYIYNISTKVNTADKNHVSHLDNGFAVCAAQFFRAFQAKYPQYAPLLVTSTWRSPQDQERVSSSPTSNHTRGYAIDVHPKGNSLTGNEAQKGYDALRDFAIANKQYGVCFARPQYEGSEDRPHMTAAGIGAVKEDCGKYGITKLCDAGAKYDFNDAKVPIPGNYTSGSGGQGYSSSLYGQAAGQSSLGKAVQYAQLGLTGAQLGQMLMQPSQTGTYAAPTTAGGTTVSSQPESVSTLIQQNCLNPNQTTSGNTTGTGAQTTLQSATNNNTSLKCLTYDDAATKKSTSELLTAVSPQNDVKIVPIALNASTQEDVNDQGNNAGSSVNMGASTQVSGPVAYEQRAPQGGSGTFSTFTSTDLKDSGSTVKASSTMQKIKNIPQATYQAILNTLKSILLKINEYISFLIQKRQATTK